MNIKGSISLLIGTIVMLFITSCEKSYVEVGANIVSDMSLQVESERYNVLAYNEKKGFGISKNNVVALGEYKESLIGTVKSAFAFQVLLSDNDPNFSEAPIVDSVVLYLPFYKRVLTKKQKDNKDKLSLKDTLGLYGNLSDEITLKIFELDEVLKHQDSIYNSKHSFKYTTLLHNGKYKIDLDSIIIKDENDNTKTKKLIPGLRVKLDKDFFKNKILNRQGKIELKNNIHFKDYFKGLYVMAENPKNTGFIVSFDVRKGKGKLKIYYKDNKDNKDIYELNLDTKGAITIKADVNTIPEVTEALNLSNKKTKGSDKLYVQGLSGLHPVVKLFDNTTILKLKNKKYAINQATVKVLIDNTTNLYDLPKKLELYNYTEDLSLIDKIRSNSVFGGELTEENGQKHYTFDITAHLHSILNTDSVNVDLGIRIDEYIKAPHRVILRGKKDIEFKIDYSK